jgi:hypothetical protein
LVVVMMMMMMMMMMRGERLIKMFCEFGDLNAHVSARARWLTCVLITLRFSYKEGSVAGCWPDAVSDRMGPMDW